MKKYFFPLLLVFAPFIFMPSCKSGSIDPRGKLQGTVVDENDLPLAGAFVKVDAVTVTTDAEGKFVINHPADNNGKVVLKATKSGYFPGYLTVTKIDESGMFTVIKLLQGQTLGTVSASSGGNLTNGADLTVKVGTTGFITESGAAYTGIVTVRARFVAADDTTIDQIMPGGFGATDTSGQAGVMMTRGAAAVEFVDQAGNIVLPKAGNVKLSFKVSSAVAASASGASAWSLNTQSGQWNQSGAVQIVGNVLTVDYLSGAVNCDFFSRLCTVNGKVVDCNGNPKAGVKVTFVSNLVRYSTYTNGAGLYRVDLASDPGSYTISAGGSSTSVSVYQGGVFTAPTITLPCATTGGSGAGNFTFSGTGYSGITVCDIAGSGGVTISSVVASNGTNSCEVENAPASGSVTVTGDYYLSGCTTCPGFQVVLNTGNSSYFAVSGNISRSGSVITFSGTCISTLDAGNWVSDPSSVSTYSASGTIHCQ